MGTALSAATCTELSSHSGIVAQRARETFRCVDDYAYRLLVRPTLNTELRTNGHDTFALGAASNDTEAIVRHDPLAASGGSLQAEFPPAEA